MKYYSETSFYTYNRTQSDGSFIFDVPGGGQVALGKDYVEKYLASSDGYTSTKKVSRRDMIDEVLNNPKTAMTISFNKKLKPTDVAEEVLAYYASTSRPSKTGLAKVLTLLGANRVMVGHHLRTFTEEGRLNFIDAEATGMPVKQVDTRTIYEVIVNGVRYQLKK